MKRREKHNNNIAIYFKSERFKKRLDTIRTQSKDPSELKALAISVATKLDLKTEYVNIIYEYLRTGTYKGSTRSPIRLIDKSQEMELEDEGVENIALDNYGVYIELCEDTTQDDLKRFITQNWTDIKDALDNNYPGRKKRFSAMSRLDNYLDIADQLNSIENGHERAALAKSLSIQYNLEVREVYAIAKKYLSILVE